MLGGKSTVQPSDNVSSEGKQSNLGKFGVEARKKHLSRNEWYKDLQYTKALVDSEYLVQTEFKVGTTDADISAQLEKQQEANMKKVDKLKKKRDKLDKQIENLGGK
jgi:hypothetical protein